MDPASFKVFTNYVALPAIEAFRIEYWALEEAKIRRQPPEKELSRRIALVVGGGSGIGREVALLAAARGAHVVVADRDAGRRRARCRRAQGVVARRNPSPASASTSATAKPFVNALKATVAAFGGIDILINTAAMFPVLAGRRHSRPACGPPRSRSTSPPTTCSPTKPQRSSPSRALDGTIVFTSSANAVVAKRGSEAYDVSKAALSHLVRELAVSLAPDVRVNGISPATVVKGSTMFPRDRVIASLTKYNIPFEESFSDEELRDRLAVFLRRAHADAQTHRSRRTARGNPLPGQPTLALHHRPPHSRGRRPDRGIFAMKQTWSHLRHGAIFEKRRLNCRYARTRSCCH